MATDIPGSHGAGRIRLIAFYLPQFHPIPENDAWWGRGFTEWTNVTKAEPLFPGHYQPHLPGELGFTDLRVRETRRAQIQLAREHGIDAFCYHYYWFSGRRLLERPLEDMLADAKSDMPFCLCWANENWTRRWDGLESEVLLEQKFLPTDDVEFIRGVERYLLDPRYLRVDGAPILIVYRPQDLPGAAGTTSVWREYWRSQGRGRLHLCAALTYRNREYARLGFDSGVEFPPHDLLPPSQNAHIDFYRRFKGNVWQLADFGRDYLDRSYPGGNVYRCVIPSWDNTARAGERATILLNGTSANYEFWLAEAIRRTRSEHPDEERLVFVNAWNEWAEGCHLEPDRRYGRGFLEATRRAVRGESTLNSFSDEALPGDERAGLLRDLRDVFGRHLWRRIVALRSWLDRHPSLARLVRGILRAVRRS